MNESSGSPDIEPLWELRPDSPLKVEWELFRRERPRLLAEGHEGRWVLVKGQELVGVFDTWEEAGRVGVQKFGVVSMLVQQICRRHKLLRQGACYRLCQP
jgi:hypothetical protein